MFHGLEDNIIKMSKLKVIYRFDCKPYQNFNGLFAEMEKPIFKSAVIVRRPE